MKKRILKQVLALTFCFVLLMSSFTVQAEEKIIPSTVDYEVNLRDASLVFIGNERAVDWKVGDKYFLTYTVTSLTNDTTIQSGMIVTSEREGTHPYLKGGMLFDQSSLICEAGYTYFFRFEVTEDGLEYVAAKAKGEESAYVEFPFTTGELKTKGPYFGIWIGEGGSVTAELTHVRCYDENGVDLGIYAPASSEISIEDMTPAEGVNHTYAFSLAEARCISFGNARKTDSDVIFLEYKVSNVNAKDVDQSGTNMTNAPTAVYPHGDNMGYLNYTPHTEQDPTKLLAEGAHYLIRFERGEESYEVLVKRTLADGTVDYFSFTNWFGTYNANFGYVAMWIGENCAVTADFTDVKCYDGAGNNLGIQTNQNVKISHFGELEDYSQCAAVYYCKETDTFISLDDECNASRRVDGEEASSQGTYAIEQAVMTLKIGEETETFDYTYNAFKDSDGNKYIRLTESTVTFKSRFMGGEVIETVQVTAADGFKVAKPSEPKEEGRAFAYWQTGEGKEYDFDEVVTENMDLYAAWDGEGEWALTSILGVQSNVMTIAIVALVCVVLVGGTVAGVVLISRGKNNGSTKKEKGK